MEVGYRRLLNGAAALSLVTGRDWYGGVGDAHSLSGAMEDTSDDFWVRSDF